VHYQCCLCFLLFHLLTINMDGIMNEIGSKVKDVKPSNTKRLNE